MPVIPILLANVLAQTVGQTLVRAQVVRPLLGSLDPVPVFNSNNPEIVKTPGILLSSFPPQGKRHPNAHLDFGFTGRFDLFFHHIARAIETPDQLQTLYLGAIVHNPTNLPVTLDIHQAASYLSQPDAPFLPAAPMAANPLGQIFRGPGDRVTNTILRGRRQENFPAQLAIPPRSTRLLFSLPIPVAQLNPPLNGRSGLLRLRSSGKVYVAHLAMYAKTNPDGSERSPTLAEWQALLVEGNLAGPRESPPSPPDQLKGKEIYGRVAGIALGSRWQARLTDPGSNDLGIPHPGQAVSYGISTLLAGKMGTGQNQSATLIKRYPGTAYQAHGNYGIEYNLTLPLSNPSDRSQILVIRFATPLKEDQLSQPGLQFRQPPFQQVFFRGSLRLRYTDDQKLPQTRYWHLVQQRGQMGAPLVTLNLPPGDRRFVQIDLIYPADATPPQVITLETLKNSQIQLE
ncbi:MAG: DUF3370 domain-containing protein [Pseudanabaenaceae cyanobacterium bins.68]|nr:DUF3370 domain-containing protein [Pseudanabaenaceae cyanobacterium bins.68]